MSARQIEKDPCTGARRFCLWIEGRFLPRRFEQIGKIRAALLRSFAYRINDRITALFDTRFWCCRRREKHKHEGPASFRIFEER